MGKFTRLTSSLLPKGIEMATKPLHVGIIKTCPNFDGTRFDILLIQFCKIKFHLNSTTLI